MNRIYYSLAALMVSALSTVAQNPAQKTAVDTPFAEFSNILTNNCEVKVGEVSFNMVCVQGGTFIMGKTIDQMYRSSSDEEPAHRVAVSSFLIGQTEVTQKLWQAVMGNNPAHFKNPEAPVENVTWEECQEFIKKLNAATGITFRLPTEAEWEYAARGGCLSGQWMHAGSDNPEDVAWYGSNTESTHPVAQKKKNDIGLFDMSGNVAEWCADWYGDYTLGFQTNPHGPQTGVERCVRGGSWTGTSNGARVAYRSSLAPAERDNATGLRLAANITQAMIAETKANPRFEGRHFAAFNAAPISTERFKINEVKFNMVGVQGGAFFMGATLEQTQYGDVDEQPCHNVAVSSFRISDTEVTQALWKAVMGENNNPSRFKGDDLPVENVTWEDCQKFIKKLNTITGKQFRLPTEAEWEYAARGGNQSMAYAFPGSDECNEVAWNAHNAKSTKPVATLKPNELGLYDMGGNVAEWCEDWYFAYSFIHQTNPQGPGIGSNKVLRGSFWEDGQRYCHISYRYSAKPTFKSQNIGFRLAL